MSKTKELAIKRVNKEQNDWKYQVKKRISELNGEKVKTNKQSTIQKYKNVD